MPTVGVKRNLLFEVLGRTFTDDEFQRLCFEFGLELDEVTTEQQMISKEQGEDSALLSKASEEVIYRIDIPANRYDLLCLEGITLGLLVFQGKLAPPNFKAVRPGKLEKIYVKTGAGQIRPYIVAAVLRDLYFTQDSYNSFIDLQEKLHQNICRKRSLVSIGTHDLDTVQGPFCYDAVPPENIKFVPLNQEKECDGNDVMELYSTHAQLKQYLPIIRDSPVYPLVTDSKGIVLSLPPIINGNHSKITLNTKNVLIECTATDLTKARVVVDTIVCMFSKYCKQQYTTEMVEVVTADSQTSKFYPDLTYRSEEISAQTANNVIGIQQSPDEVVELLNKMCLKSEIENDKIKVLVPPTRHDVIHPCDIYEDVAIAFGYNKIERTVPKTNTFGHQLPINKLTDLLREPVAQSGFTEALTFALCSRDDISTKLGLKPELGLSNAVHISNPKTLEFQVCRTTLLPGILKTIAANKKMPLPLKIFEIQDVVIKDPNTEVGARNERRLCAVNCNKNAGFEVVHGLLDKIMLLLEVPWKTQNGYHLEADNNDPAYFPGRCAKIIYNGNSIGKVGVLHPNVLNKFELTNPCSVVEFSIEPFV